MQQRALMATVVTAYSKMKAICDHSFEGVEVGAKTMGEFIKNNLNVLANSMPEINVTEYKSQTFAENKYMVSKGTLAPVNSTIKGNNVRFDTGVAIISGDSISWDEIATKMGIKKDGMLTFLIIFEKQCLWLRIKFKSEMIATQPTIGDSGFINELAEVGGIEGNSLELSDIIVLNKDVSGNYFFEVKLNEGDAAAAIISERDENTWKRSTAYLNGNISNLFDAAFSTYPINTTLLLNGGKMSSNVL